mgnify:CR=1 FL=1
MQRIVYVETVFHNLVYPLTSTALAVVGHDNRYSQNDRHLNDSVEFINNDYRMSKRQKSLFTADFSADAKSQKQLFASISLQQKSTNFLSKFVSKSKICCRNSRISTFDCRYAI